MLMPCFVIAVATSPLFAQESVNHYTRDAIYAEGFGPGILYSINCDHRFTPNFSLRVGFTTWSLPAFALLVAGELKFTAFPIMVNYLTGQGDHHLELGIGLVPAVISFQGEEIFFGTAHQNRANVLLGAATIGYRMQPRDSGVIFRIGFTPLFTFKEFVPWAGLSLGVALKE